MRIKITSKRNLALAVAAFLAAGRVGAQEPTTISDKGDPLSRAKTSQELAEPKTAASAESQQAPPHIAAEAPPMPAPTAPAMARSSDAASGRTHAFAESGAGIPTQIPWPWRFAIFALVPVSGLMLWRMRYEKSPGGLF